MSKLRKFCKLRGVVSIFLVLCTVALTILSPLTVRSAKADSNSRRKAMLNLASGAKLTDLDASENIDSDSLRVISLFLSNFYVPFGTVFDADWSNDKEAQNSEYRKNMVKALTQNCGFNSDTAEYLVDYCLSQNLNTCQKMYVKENDLKQIWVQCLDFNRSMTAHSTTMLSKEMSDSETKTRWGERLTALPSSSIRDSNVGSVSDGGAISGLSSKRKGAKKKDTPVQAEISATSNEFSSLNFDLAKVNKGKMSLDLVYSIGFIGPQNIGGATANSNNTGWHGITKSVWGLHTGGTKQSIFMYRSFNQYKKLFKAVKIGKVSYVPVSYPVFLSIMNYCYEVASYDVNMTLNRGASDAKNKSYWKKGKKTISHPFSNTYSIANRNAKFTTKIPVINFYTPKTSKKMSVVFANSEECMQAYALVNDTAGYDNGYGSAFMAISDVDFYSGAKSYNKVWATAPANLLYVNWIGDIVLDNGVYRSPIFPGCANPFVLSQITSSPGQTIPMQNTWAIERALDGKLYHSKEYGGSTRLKVYVGECSLFNLNAWRLGIGTTEVDVDKNKKFCKDSFGSMDKVFKCLDKSGIGVTTNGRVGKDYNAFPSWFLIAMSYPYNNVANWNGTKEVKNHRDNDYMLLGSRNLYGAVVWNTDLAWVDSFSAIKDNQKLSTYFAKQDLSDKTFLSKLDKIQTYADFKSLKKQGVVASYSSATKKTFTPLFETYTLAYFNENATKVEEKGDGTNFINLKTNFGSFPDYNNNIEWSSLSSDNLQGEVLSLAYYFLHPKLGVGYVATWFKNKVSGILLNWHEDVVGSSDSNSSLGMTKYLGFSGYTTVPNLYDIDWVASLLEAYNSIIVYLIIIITLILLCYILVGSMTFQRAMLGVVMFGVLAFVPPFAINATVDASNRICSSVYSKKFDYWAICQMQQYLLNYSAAKSAQSKGDISTYNAFILNTNYSASTASSDGGESETFYGGVKLKWMSPKKYSTVSSFASSFDSATKGTTATYLKSWLYNAVAQQADGETFVENDDALYLYRDYSDIYRYGATSYHIQDVYNFSGKLLNLKQTGWCNSGGSDFGDVMYTTYSTGANATLFNVEYGVRKYKTTPCYTSGENLKDYIFTNTASTTEAVINVGGNAQSGASSLFGIKAGFLVNTIGYKPTGTKDEQRMIYYSYNGKKQSNTLASTYLTHYCEAWLNTSKHLDKLKQVSKGKKGVSLDNSKLTDDTLIGLPLDCYKAGVSNVEGYAKDTTTKYNKAFTNLSYYLYGLYAESPFYYFNFNVRDQVNTLCSGYSFDKDHPDKSGLSTSQVNNVDSMLIDNNQSYFYNLSDSAGDGYGELKDFMNMHDFFYYIVPELRYGTELARLYDEMYGLNTDDECAVSFNSNTGKVSYKGEEYTLDKFNDNFYSLTGKNAKFTDAEKYKIWHTINTYSVMQGYSSWLDTLMDCKYAKSERIHVMGDSYLVENPLDPTSYYKKDDAGQIVKGRYMVFSESEMKYYGLTEADLTTVEKKIIKVQNNVYKKAISLMNYYTLSDEAIIQAYSMIQLFEFNKEFSQETILGKDYTLYPQAYELKAFTYDAYLRLIISEASGENLMTSNIDSKSNSKVTNTSIYKRVQNNTSIFFSIFMLLNDVLAVYVIPLLKLFFIIFIFLLSIVMIVASAVKLDLNLVNVTWRSLLAPLLSFAFISIVFAWFVSMFMTNGADAVTETSKVINLGDPTMAMIVMIVVNVVVTIMYWKIVKKVFMDFRQYTKAVATNIGGMVTGAVGAITTGALAGKIKEKFGSKGGSGVADAPASTAEQRGRDNDPRSRKRFGFSKSKLTPASEQHNGVSRDMMSKAEKERLDTMNARKDAEASMNKYDAKAFRNANSKTDKLKSKYDKAEHKLNKALENGASERKQARLFDAMGKREEKMNRSKMNAENIRKYGSVRAAGMRVSKGIGRGAASFANAGSRIKDTGAFVRGRFSDVEYSLHTRGVGGTVKHGASVVGNKTVGRGMRAVKKGAGSVRDEYSASRRAQQTSERSRLANEHRRRTYINRNERYLV